ncbi:hypothetical protein L1856_00645 [Streptomyces sp. Tue 6430]|nr:hypothetical protein [Streptomyces sp. Tue 6430]
MDRPPAVAVVPAVRAAGTRWPGRRRRACSCVPESAGEGGCGCHASENPLEITGAGRRWGRPV